MTEQGDESDATAVDEIDSVDGDLVKPRQGAELDGERAFFEHAGAGAGLGEEGGGIGGFDASKVGAGDGAEVPDQRGFFEFHAGNFGFGREPWACGGDEPWHGHESGSHGGADEENHAQHGGGDGGGAEDGSGGGGLCVELDGEPDGQQWECGQRVVRQFGSDEGEGEEHEGGSPQE